MVVKKSSSFNCDIHDVVEMDTSRKRFKNRDQNENYKIKGGCSGWFQSNRGHNVMVEE
jgi:hypothetical protein